MVTYRLLAVLSLGIGKTSSVHIVLEDEGHHSDGNGDGQSVGNGDPEISVDVEEDHADESRPTAEPAVGLVEVLEEEEGEESGSYEEEGVDGVLSLHDSLEEEASGVSVLDLADILHVLDMEDTNKRAE